MLKTIKTYNQIKKFVTRYTARISSDMFASKLVMVVVLFAFIGVANSQTSPYDTTISFKPGDINMFSIEAKKTPVIPGIAKADIDKLNNDPEPEIIKAFMQQLGYEYGIDWKLVYAIGYHESGNYNSALAQRNRNYFGRKATSGGYASWSTPEEAIRNQFEYLKTRYFDRGMDTPSKINPVYAEDSTWHCNVERVMASL